VGAGGGWGRGGGKEQEHAGTTSLEFKVTPLYFQEVYFIIDANVILACFCVLMCVCVCQGALLERAMLVRFPVEVSLSNKLHF